MSAAVDHSHDAAAVDLAVMRADIHRLVDPDRAPVPQPPTGDELAALTETLRGHLRLLIPQIETEVSKLDKQSPHRYCVLGCLGDARIRLRAQPTDRYGGPIGHARRLARALHALCEHHDELTALSS